MEDTPIFLRGTIPFTGAGYDSPVLLPGMAYTVPSSRRCQTIYFRAGNSCDEMIVLVMLRDGKVMRYFPIGAKAASHVQLAVVEDIEPDQKIELSVAAPAGVGGTVVVDLGLIEI